VNATARSFHNKNNCLKLKLIQIKYITVSVAAASLTTMEFYIASIGKVNWHVKAAISSSI
jgi:hypothetical protein